MKVRVKIAHGFWSVGDIIPDMPAAQAEFGIATGRLEQVIEDAEKSAPRKRRKRR